VSGAIDMRPEASCARTSLRTYRGPRGRAFFCERGALVAVMVVAVAERAEGATRMRVGAGGDGGELRV